MRCINCGAPLNDENAIFCEKCFKLASSQSNEDIKPNNMHREESPAPSNKRPPQKKKKKKALRNSLIIAGSVVLALILVVVLWVVSLFGSIQKGSLSGDLAINESGNPPFNEEVKNIALYGLDTREHNNKGRTDAIIVLSIDRVNNAIKFTSIARDTYIQYQNGKHDKITHAWAYGGANLAVKTLNYNFGLDITDYVTVNFYQFAEIIDYIGGVEIDVSEAEMKVMNREHIPYTQSIGIETKLLTHAGLQILDGGQALSYARDRDIGGDIARGGRQREVLAAMFEAAKKMNPLKYPKLIEMVLEQCTTTLDSSEMLSIGMWAVTNGPELQSMGFPNDECKSTGQMINGTSYVVYDLDKATEMLHDFIYGKKEEISSEVS